MFSPLPPPNRRRLFLVPLVLLVSALMLGDWRSSHGQAVPTPGPPPISSPLPSSGVPDNSRDRTQTLNILLDNMQKIIAMVAIAAAAAGAYMKYFVGRLYDAKPLVEVCGEWIASTTTDRERPLLLARAKVVNNGLLPLTVHSESSGVRLLCCPAANWVPELAAVTWEHVASFPILEDHDWLNPGETVHDELLVPLPAGSGALAYLLELRFTSSVRGIARAQREHIVTTARSIVAVDSAAQDKARMEVSG